MFPTHTPVEASSSSAPVQSPSDTTTTIRQSNEPYLHPPEDAKPEIPFNFMGLSAEIRIQVIGQVQKDQGPVAIQAVMNTSRLLRWHVTSTPSLRLPHAQQRRIAVAATACARAALTYTYLIAGCGRLLGWVPYGLRGDLVAAALGIRDEEDKARAIAGLGAGLAHLSEPQRGDLVTAALGFTDEELKATATAGLGAEGYL